MLLAIRKASNGRKRWAMRLVVNGRRRDFGLGPIHKVGPADAREMEYRAKAYRGIDPVEHKRGKEKPVKVPIFKEPLSARPHVATGSTSISGSTRSSTTPSR